DAGWQTGGAPPPVTSNPAAAWVAARANADHTNTHGIDTGRTAINLRDLPASPLITTSGANQQALTLAVGNATLTTGVSIYNSAAAFSTRRAATLDGPNTAYRLGAGVHE